MDLELYNCNFIRPQIIEYIFDMCENCVCVCVCKGERGTVEEEGEREWISWEKNMDLYGIKPSLKE